MIESCKIVHGVIENSLDDFPNMTIDPKVKKRKSELIREARILLSAIKKLGTKSKKDPWISPEILSRAIEIGLLDAPHFKSHKFANGAVETRIIQGACYAVNPKTGGILTEKARIAQVFAKKI